jgi:hypothetical protein
MVTRSLAPIKTHFLNLGTVLLVFDMSISKVTAKNLSNDVGKIDFELST